VVAMAHYFTRISLLTFAEGVVPFLPDTPFLPARNLIPSS